MGNIRSSKSKIYSSFSANETTQLMQTNISTICQKCANRSFDPKVGLICGITQAKPDFTDTCSKFEVDKVNARREDNKAQLEAKSKREYGIYLGVMAIVYGIIRIIMHLIG